MKKNLPPFKVFVEGAGDGGSLRSECREAFSEFLQKAGIGRVNPRIVACGSRNNAMEHFKTALDNGDTAILLVDSECEVEKASSWEHLEQHEGEAWIKPQGAADIKCHLMVQSMEAWLLADQEAVFNYYNVANKDRIDLCQGSIEKKSPAEMVELLSKAAQRRVKNRKYDKGRDSFKLLALADPTKVISACLHAQEFINAVKTLGAERLG